MAAPHDVLRHVFGSVLRWALAATAAGVSAALAARLLRRLLFQVAPFHPRALATFALPLAGALVAVALPARRAARIDPALAWPEQPSAPHSSIRRVRFPCTMGDFGTKNPV